MDGFFVEGGDPELVAAMQRQHELQHMSINDKMHAAHKMFETLEQDDLENVIFLLHTLTHNPDMTPYFSGIAIGQRMVRFKVCPACGLDHDKEAAELLEQANDERVNEELTEWGIELNPEGGLRCANCKMPVHSLEDRKLRVKGAEGCDGCQQKAKFG
jgi:hypothetical protein